MMSDHSDKNEQHLSFHLLHSAAQAKHVIPVFVAVTCRIHILRTLDPEDEHQVSLARILQAAKITMVDGLCKFDLVKNIDYHVDLGFSGPNISELWVNIRRARSIVADLWESPPASLVQLLAPCLDPCWTLHDISRNSLLHNWRISTLKPVAYSTSLLLRTVFDTSQIVSPLDKSHWIRSGVPDLEPETEQSNRDTHLLNWAVAAAERSQECSEHIPNHWTPVVQMLEDILDVPDHGTLRGDSSAASATQMEVDLVSAYERLLQHAVEGQRGPRRQIEMTSVACSARPDTRSVSIQTEDPPVFRKKAQFEQNSQVKLISWLAISISMILLFFVMFGINNSQISSYQIFQKFQS